MNAPHFVRSSAAFGTLCLALGACAGSTPPPADPPPPDMGPAPSASAESKPPADQTEKPSSAKVEQAIDALKKQDFAAAKTLLTAARAENQKDPQAAYYLGVALQGLNDAAGAKSAYQDALKLDAKLTEASVNLSALLLDAKDADGALSVCDSGLKTQPKQPDLLLNRALALEAQGKKDESLKAYGAAAAASPDNIELHIAYAELLTAAGDEKGALDQLHGVANTDDPKLLAALSVKFGRLHAFGDCISALDHAIKIKDSADLHVRRAVCRHDAKDAAGAVDDYKAALKIDDKFAPAHYYLGKQLCKTDKKQALEHLNKAAQLAANSDIGKRAKESADKAKAGKCGE
ncbi:MAG TPA: tetratricopeptide repeat protein [Polyangiaceae bacterium]